MRNIPSQAQRPNSISAIFEDGISTFLFPSDATLEDLAGRLAQLGIQHQGRAIAFKVKLNALSA